MTAASTYHEVHLTEHPARAAVWQTIAEYLSPWIPAEARVLEIGAGHCHWINAVRAPYRLAVDVWPDVGRFAAPGVEVRVLDVSRDLATLPAGSFDGVLASNVLEHFEPDTASHVVAGIFTLLKPGGRVFIVQPNFRYAYRSYFDDYTHRSVFTDVSLANMLRSHGFRVERSMPRFLPYSMRDVRARVPPWLVRAYLRSPFKPRAGQMLLIASRP